MLDIHKLTGLGLTLRKYLEPKEYEVQFDDGVETITPAQILIAMPLWMALEKYGQNINIAIIPTVTEGDLFSTKDLDKLIVIAITHLFNTEGTDENSHANWQIANSIVYDTYVGLNNMDVTFYSSRMGGYSAYDMLGLNNDVKIVEARERAVVDNRLIANSQAEINKRILSLDGPISILTRLGLVKLGQLGQGVGLRGWGNELDRSRIPIPMLTSLLDSWRTVDLHILIRDAAISYAAQTHQLGVINYEGRKLKARTTRIRHLVNESCNSHPSNGYVTRMRVDKALIPSIIGMNHWDENENYSMITEEMANTLIGRVISLRTPQTCMHTDGNICVECMGEMAKLTPRDRNLGYTATIGWLSAMFQKVLSMKYTLAHMINEKATKDNAGTEVFVMRQNKVTIKRSKYSKVKFSIDSLMVPFIIDLATPSMPSPMIVEMEDIVATAKKDVNIPVVAVGTVDNPAEFHQSFRKAIGNGVEVKSEGRYVTFEITGDALLLPIFKQQPQKMEAIDAQVKRITNIVTGTLGTSSNRLARLIEEAGKVNAPIHASVAAIALRAYTGRLLPEESYPDIQGKLPQQVLYDGEPSPIGDDRTISLNSSTSFELSSLAIAAYLKQKPVGIRSTSFLKLADDSPERWSIIDWTMKEM